MAAAEAQITLALENVDVVMDSRPILSSISLTVEKRSIVSIIGPNGAGKTTLFNVICGQVRPCAGRVIHESRDITRSQPHEICHGGISRTFQIPRPFPEMTALENVQAGLWFGKGCRGRRPPSATAAAELLEVVGLAHKERAPARELTLSEQRRLEVARALGTRPRLLLLDEIAAGLSPGAIRHAVELVLALRERGLTLLIIDHFLNLTARVSDRLIALDEGKLIVEGKPSDVLDSPSVIASYLGEPLPEAGRGTTYGG
ncbi:MAG: ABC transporter ATP-binding protein [Syntrophobacteraceae bacterium]|jgi:branched-chain amino acid transport system ATP-binding protein|nr:ABC transporter ATP-binding protein [Syntrophobacteraceae bacterium]